MLVQTRFVDSEVYADVVVVTQEVQTEVVGSRA